MADTTFSAGTVVASTWLNDINDGYYKAQSGIAGSTDRTALSKFSDVVSVLDFGADNTGVSDSYAAFTAAWAYIKTLGGVLLIPPGTYLLNTQWLIDPDQTTPRNYLISGYGATIISGAAVTGYAIKVFKAYNYYNVTMEGLAFDHRGNTTVQGCVQNLNSHHFNFINCIAEVHSTKSGWAGIEIGPITAGSDVTNTFWCNIEGFKIRTRSGSDLYTADVTGTFAGTVLTVPAE